ncbi:MAG: ABC-2 family transporter protein [Ardenticatenales bacterium]|nr:ABC-2 family transporter protein [Ardenticatenales bacterium]
MSVGAAAERRGAGRQARRSAAKYAAVVRTQLAHGLAYPADLVMRSLTIVIFMWVFIHLWRSTYATTGQASVRGLTLNDTLWYLVLAESITLSKPRVATAIALAVRDGSVAYQLSKPYNFLGYQAAVTVGDALVRGWVTVLLGGALVAVMIGPPPSMLGWPLALVAVIAGWLIDFCMATLIGLMAFVIEDVAAFEWIYSKLILVLGGVLLPLDFLPDGFRRVAEALPFAYTTWAPARLFVSPDPALFVRLFGIQLAWLAGLALLVAMVHRQCTTRLAVNGG